MPSTNGRGYGPERIGLYMRVSSEEQERKQSIKTQEGFLEEYCKLYGHEVAEIYMDEAISGTVPMRERPEGRRLLDDAKAGALDVVLVYKLDRIGRSLVVVIDAHDRLQEAGVALRCATEPIDTSTPAGRLIFQMLASFAEFERATITERSRDGLQRAFEEGKHLGCIPFGYDVAEDGAFVIVEDEARIVREIIANIAGGATLYSEAKRLNHMGEPSPGRKYRGRPRKHGPSWCHSTVRGIVTQGAYAGTHVVNAHKGPVERAVPAIVDGELHRRALERLEENKRYSGGKNRRRYLLRGLVTCAHCGTACTGDISVSTMGYRYHYYSCRRKRVTSDKRTRGLTCPRIKAQWLEDLVWADVRSFVQNPGEVLERVRQQLSEESEGEGLVERHASLVRRLAAKQEEKSRYVKLYAQGHVDEGELEIHLADLKYQVENLKLLISSVESDLAQKEENRLAAKSTEAWLMTLRKNLWEVEQDTEEAWGKRRELAKLLVEKISIGRNGDGRAEVQVTYRFGPPEAPLGDESANGVQNSEEFARAHGQGGGEGLLRGHPKITVYEVAVEREAERYYGPD